MARTTWNPSVSSAVVTTSSRTCFPVRSPLSPFLALSGSGAAIPIAGACPWSADFSRAFTRSLRSWWIAFLTTGEKNSLIFAVKDPS